MPTRRTRRRGDWARRLVRSPSQSSDSDHFACDSSSSGDSLSVHDFSPHLEHCVASLRRRKSSPPSLDARNVSFPEYAVSELPDLAIFFRQFLPPLSPVSSPSCSSPSLSPHLSRAGSSPSGGRGRLSRGASCVSNALPPTFPESFRHQQSEPISQSYQTPPTTPKLSRSALRSPEYKRKLAAAGRACTPDATHVSSNHNILSSTCWCNHCSAPLLSKRYSNGSTSAASGRKHCKDRSRQHSPRVVPSRRHREDFELSRANQFRRESMDPDRLDRCFLLHSICRWYKQVMRANGERWWRTHYS
ncbi:hypothetical protein FGB62_48g10 [Gracilaria domingensis]|nr:hypothetical protein FGB62_48g10 [Gracilaria domingensis]